jgi:hypothetical protein
LDQDVGVLIVLVGTVGVLLQARRGLSEASFDPLPLVVLLVWAVVIAIETRSAPFEARYLYAATTPLLLGAAVAVGQRLPARLRGGRALATLGAIAVLAVTTTAMPGPVSPFNRELATAMPAIERTLTCGRIRIISRSRPHRPDAVRPVLAALTRRGLNEFSAQPTDPTLAAILVLGGRRRLSNGWTGPHFGSLTLALSPRCDRKTHQ